MGASCGCFDGVKSSGSSLSRASTITHGVSQRIHDISSVTGGDVTVGRIIAKRQATGIHRQLKDYYQTQTYELLGEGGFGQVFKTVNIATGVTRAVKYIAKDEEFLDAESVGAELFSLLELDHQNVCKLIEWFETEQDICIITELLDGSDLSKYVLSSSVQVVFTQCMQGLAYCHSKGFAHRDMKMENCIVVQGAREQDLLLKLIDFGFAAIKKETDKVGGWCHDTLGTPLYMSPAVVTKGASYGVKCDIWSSGVMLYMLLTNEHPFCKDTHLAVDDMDELFRRIKNDDFRQGPLTQNGCAEQETSLIAAMLTKDVDKRPGALELLEQFEWLIPCSLETSPFLAQKHLSWALVYSQKATKFEKALLTVLARQTHYAELSAMRAIFNQNDTNGDGYITQAELAKAFGASGFQLSGPELQSIFSAISIDGDDTIEYTEWLAATLEPGIIIAESAAKIAMDFFSHHHPGAEHHETSLHPVQVLDRKLSRENIAAMSGEDSVADVLKLWDADGDDHLSLTELKVCLANIAERRKDCETLTGRRRSHPKLNVPLAADPFQIVEN